MTHKSDDICKNITGSPGNANMNQRVEKKLREIDKKFRSIIDGYFEIDLEGNFTFLNDSICRQILGYSKEEAMGMNFRTFMDAQAAKTVFQEFNAIYKTDESSKQFECLLIKKDGTKIHIESSAVLLKNASGKPIGFRGIINDITRRKQAEEALLQSEEKYRSILENIREAYFEVDLAGNFTFFNDALCHLTGCSKEELIGTNYNKFSDEENSKIVFKTFHQVFKTGTPTEGFEWSINRANGAKRYVESSISLRKDASGNPIGFKGVLRDITGRRRSEENLLKSEKKFASIFHVNPNPMAMTEMVTGTIIDVNLSFTEWSGYSREELIGASTKDFNLWVNPEDREKMVGTLMATGAVNNLEILMSNKNGRIGNMLLSARFIEIEEERYVLILINDITERKEGEIKLQQALVTLRKSYGVTIQVLVQAVEIRDPYTAGHQVRVADIARSIATEMGLPKETIDGIRMAGTIHDIGKLSIPSEILTKPTKLTNLEYSMIKEHAQKGFEMLQNVEAPWPLAQIIYQHHERIDGSGYPRNLKGDEILIEARILAVADVVEAIASHRPYRPSLGLSVALDEIEMNKGVIYDSTVVDACLKLFRENGYKLP